MCFGFGLIPNLSHGICSLGTQSGRGQDEKKRGVKETPRFGA